MTRRRKDPLRELTPDEKADLESISRARSAPAEAVTRAKILLGVASGMDYQQAARSAGRKSGDAVSALVSRFNQEGLEALMPRDSATSGFQSEYGPEAKARILHAVSARYGGKIPTWRSCLGGPLARNRAVR